MIFVSALEDMKDKANAFKAGGVDYISKPVEAQEVPAKVKTHVTLHRMREDIKALEEALEERTKALERLNKMMNDRNS